MYGVDDFSLNLRDDLMPTDSKNQIFNISWERCEKCKYYIYKDGADPYNQQFEPCKGCKHEYE
jgi:hypothetical protein